MLIRAKIVLGIKDKNGTSPIYPGGVADVDENLGKRMVLSGYAEDMSGTVAKSTAVAAPVSLPVENPSEPTETCMTPKTPVNDDVTEESLQAVSYTELKSIAKKMGIETGKIKSKAGMIEAILSANDFDEAPPVFDAQEVID